jgi:hypothetical protein
MYFKKHVDEVKIRKKKVEKGKRAEDCSLMYL